VEEEAMSLNNANLSASVVHTADFSQNVAWAAPQLSPTVIQSSFELAPLVQLPRVLSQTVAAGLIVPQGTTVDVVVAPSQDIPIEIFAGVPDSLKGKMVKTVFPALTQAVQTVLAKDVPVSSLTEADKTAIVTALSTIGVTVTTAQVDQALVDTLRNTALFL
jgi:hypothetical protein